MSSNDRFKAALARKGATGVEVAEAVGTKQATLSRVVRGYRPGNELWSKIAKFLGVSVEWLRFGDADKAPSWAVATPPVRHVQSPTTTYTTKTEQLFPAAHSPRLDASRPDYNPANPDQLGLVGAVSAGDGAVMYLDQPKAFKWKRRPVMRVVGNSAYPVAFDGQFVVVDLDTPPRHNNLVIIEADEEDENGQTVRRSYFKRYCITPSSPDGFSLASVNAGIDSPYIPQAKIVSMVRVVGVLFEE